MVGSMSIRRSDALYPGPRGMLDLAGVAELGRRAVVLPKYDGVMVRAITDGAGWVRHLLLRSGEPAPAAARAAFARVRHAPDAVLVGELEAMTEAGQRVAARRGYPLIHLWDAQRIAGRDVAGEAFAARRDALQRAIVQLETADPDRPWVMDGHGAAHDRTTGRFKKAVPQSWRRMPVAPSLPADAAARAWSEWVDGATIDAPIEGLVACKVDAPIGRRGAKSKVKRRDTLDAVVLAADARAAIVTWNGYTFSCSAVGRDLSPGHVVELAHEGWLERRVEPKHPRIVRVRSDLGRAA